MTNGNSKLGICMINPVFTHHTGGMQRQCWVQSRALVNLGHRVFLLQREDPDFTEMKKQQWNFVEFLFVQDPFRHFPSRMPGLRGLRGLSFILLGLIVLIRHRSDINILHAHQLSSPALLSVFARWIIKRPAIAKATASGVWGEAQDLKKLWTFRARKFVIRQLDRVIAITGDLKIELCNDLEISSFKVVSIPNAVVLPIDIHRTFQINGNFRILYCGRISMEKRIDTLLEAATVLAGRGRRNLQIDIVGTPFKDRDAGAQIEEPAKKASEAGVLVKFHGHQSHVAAFYQQANVFVLASESEGMSNALLEAMSHGTPAVVSKIEGNMALIESEKNGLFFDVGDVDGLATQLDRLYNDQLTHCELSKALTRNARKKIEDNFSDTAIAHKLEATYLQVLGER